jgi:hypothetical protein
MKANNTMIVDTRPSLLHGARLLQLGRTSWMYFLVRALRTGIVVRLVPSVVIAHAHTQITSCSLLCQRMITKHDILDYSSVHCCR